MIEQRPDAQAEISQDAKGGGDRNCNLSREKSLTFAFEKTYYAARLGSLRQPLCKAGCQGSRFYQERPVQGHHQEPGMIKDLVVKNRTYRRFDQDFAIGVDTLRELVELARLSGSAGNKQPLKYILSCDPLKNALIFEHLAWAGYLTDWPGPAEGERPSAYILMLGDKEISSSFDFDNGIAAQSILLGAVEKGLGGCMIASIQRPKLREKLNIPDRYEILLVIALGKPVETVILETVKADGDIKYWRDHDGRHHVPKRSLDDIVLA
jgi:nitroreductase